MRVICNSKQYILKKFLVLGFIILFLTGCQSNQISTSFESLLSIDKTVTSISNNEDVENLYDETTDKENENVDKTYENFDNKSKEEYYTGLDKLTKTADKKGEPLSKTIFVQTHGAYTQFKLYAPLICFVSIFSGAIIFLFARGNKAARKFGLVGLVISVPLLTLFIVYGVGFMYGIFVY